MVEGRLLLSVPTGETADTERLHLEACLLEGTVGASSAQPSSDSTSKLCRRANSGVQPHNEGTTASQPPEASLSVAVSPSPPPHAAPAYAYPSPYYAAPLGGVVTWTSVFIVSCLTLTTLAGSFIAAVLYIKPMLEAAEKASLQANIAALQMEKAAQVRCVHGTHADGCTIMQVRVEACI